jgi:Protein NO VEIN, C-terminal
MNPKIRKLLIDRAISDKPIYYGEIMQLLGLKAGVNEDHDVLSKTLADISRFEKANDRPLLSAIATYSPETARSKNGETHGNGFFDLAELLGCGNKSQLKRDMFALVEMTRCREYWRDKSNFDQYYNFPDDPIIGDNPAFFSQEELGPLTKRDPPAEGWEQLPDHLFSFEGVDVNWEQQMKEQSEIGMLGEELVIAYEKKILNSAGLPDYANQVAKQKDGAGYDIFSRNLDGSEKKIEVKTTTGKAEVPFMISLPEITFSSLNADSFVLYRVYNLDKERRVAEFYEYRGDLSRHFLFEGALFRAYNKKK